MKKTTQRLAAAASLVLALCPAMRALANATNRWEFDTATNYVVSDPLDIEVAGGKARLTRHEGAHYDATLQSYFATNVTSSGVHMGPDASVGLLKKGSVYLRGGEFLSRVLDRGQAANTWQAFITRVSNRNLPSENSRFETPSGMAGLLSLWHFNNNALDATGARNGTAMNGATFTTSAKFGTHSTLLDGRDDYIDVPFSPGFASAFTISFWVRAVQTEGQEVNYVVSFGSGAGLRMAIFLGGTYNVGGSLPRAIGLYDPVVGLVSTPSGTFSDANDAGVWRHIAFVYDRNASPRLQIYKDMQLQLQPLPLTQDLTFNYTSINIGRRHDARFYWSGQVDEVAMFDRALGREELQYLNALGAPVKVQIRSDASPEMSTAFVGYDGTSNTFFLADVALIPTNNFDPKARYVQYRLLLEPSPDLASSPFLQTAAFLGNRVNVFDYTQGDFLRGSYKTNSAFYPLNSVWGYIGLGKHPNGGYFPDGEYISRILDAGEQVVWDSIVWGRTGQGVANNASGLAGLWPMDGNWADTSGKGHPGNASGVTFTSLAKLGSGSCVFDGISSRVAIGNVGRIGALEFWASPEEVDDAILSLNSTNVPYVAISKRYVQTVGFPAGTEIYLNGSSSSSRLVPGWNHIVLNISAGVNVPNFVLGALKDDYFKGAMDDLAVYSRALTPTEISEHYVTGRQQIAGQARAQARAANTISALLRQPFTGPGGTTNNFYVDPAGARLSAPDTQFLQYRLYLEGDGNATPGVAWVRVTHSGSNLASTADLAVESVGLGSFTAARTLWYGDDIAPVKISSAGPFNSEFPDDSSVRGVWHMDDAAWSAGPTVRDSSGQGRNGTPSGDAKVTTPAKVGLSCGQFDGSGDYVTLQPVNDLGSSDFSVMLWFNTTSTNRSALISSYDGDRYYALEMNSAGETANAPGRVCFIINDGFGGKKVVVSVRGGLNDGRWHHVAGVRRTPFIQIYVDGDRVGATEIGSTYGNVGASIVLTLARNGTATQYYSGQLDEALFFKRALSEGEVGELAAAGFSVTGSGTFTGPVMDGGQPVVWGKLSWGSHGPSGTALDAGDASLMGLWHLDGTAADATPRGNTGTVVGATFVAGGVFSNALSLSGPGQKVEVPDNSSIEPPVFSIEVWVRPGGNVGNQAIVDKRNAGNGYALGTDDAGNPYFWLSGTRVSDALPLDAGVWTHISGVYDGTRMLLYVNGEVRASSLPVGVQVGTANPLKFGEGNVGGSFLGLIDEVAVHNRALLPEEVLDHYRSYAVTLRFQARSADALPLASSFVGPDGTTNSYFVEPAGSDMIGRVPTARYFQYRGYLGTRSYRYPSVLKGVKVDIYSYSTFNPSVEPSTGYRFEGRLLSYSDLRSFDTNGTTDVRYQVTADAGPTNRWFYWDTSAGEWTVVDPLGGPAEYPFQSSTRADVNGNIAALYDRYYSKYGGSFRFKAFLHSLGDTSVELDWVSLVVGDGRVLVVIPNGLETGDDAWLTGVPYVIEWEHGGRVTGTVRIDYWDEVLSTWLPIASNISATADRYPWTTPAYNLTETEVRKSQIRVLHQQDLSIGDLSDGQFDLVKRYRLVEPNGGSNQVWYVGETNAIVWDAAAGLGDAKLDYSGDNTWGAPVAIVESTRSVGGTRSNKFDWVIPMTNAALPSMTAKVRVQTPGERFTDYSDRFFTMAGAAFVSPSFREKVRRGVTYRLAWNSALCGPLVDIEFQRVSTDPWITVATNVPNVDGPNTLDWVVAASASVDARLRISSQSDPRAKGISPSFIIAAIDVVRPKGAPDPAFSEKWLMGTTEPVGWVSAGVSSNINIRFSYDGGKTWLPVASNYPNVSGEATNWYSWKVPNYPTASARVRVEDAESPELWAMSPYNFQIAGLAVTWPNGPATQEWVKGVADRVRWVAHAVGDNGTVELSYDEGLGWTNVAPGGGSLPLIDGASPRFTPIHPSTGALVRIRANAPPPPFTNVVDLSDDFFTIAGVELLDPVADYQTRIGATNVIRFIAAGTHDPGLTADIYYSSDDGATFDADSPIVRDFIFQEGFPGKNENIYKWKIETSRKPSTKARIKVQTALYSVVSEAFTVKGLRFDEPGAGTVWDPGTNVILWSAAGVVGEAVADIYLSIDGGGFTNKLNPTGIPISEGRFEWGLTRDIAPSTNAVLRIVVTNSVDSGLETVSQPFTIRGLMVFDPAQGAGWELGAVQTIRWKAAAAGDSVNLYYSADNGTNYEAAPIQLAVPSGDGFNTLDWTVEKTRMPSATARVRLVSNTKIEGLSAAFEARGIKILRPNDRDIYATTDTNNLIGWVAVGDAGPYTLTYVSDGRPPAAIVSGYGPRSYTWPIPALAAGSNVVITITGNRYQNESPSFRIVTQPTVIIGAPRPGAFWQINGRYQIEWSRGGSTIPNNFTVSYSLKPYTSTVVIATGAVAYDATNNLFSVPWVVPDVPTQAKILVQNNTLPAVGDVSGAFNIVGRFSIQVPNGGEEFFAARPTPVIWRTLGSVKAVDLYYSVTPPYRADSWVKINSTPIANNFNSDLTAAQTAWPWPVVDLRSPRVKVRVQEAAYTNLFDEGQEGPYDDSDDPFTIRYYTIYWRVFNLKELAPLDELSVVDSSGWSTTGVSSIGGPIAHDYRWGNWNTVWYRRFYNDAPVLNWNPESGGKAAWTQDVFMTRSEIEPDYKVLANFTYDFATKNFTTYAWIERGGALLPAASKCVITVYDSTGSQIGEYTNTKPRGNGVFVTVWDASMLLPRGVYFAKVEIEFAGTLYSAGVTFNLQVPAGEAAIADIVGQAESNILASISGVSNEVSGVGSSLQALRRDMTNLSAFSQQATNLLNALVSMTNTLEFLSNQMVSVVGPAVTNTDALVSQMSQDAESALARILTRPTTVEYGSPLSILFKTRRGFGSGVVDLSVTPGGPSAVKMNELVGGIYQADLTANWGTNTYTITCTDPAGNADKIIVDVVTRGSLGDVPAALSSITNQLNGIQTTLYAMTNVNWNAISNVAATVGAITSAIYGVNWAALTNVSGSLAGVSEGVASLTNQLLRVNWSAITNVSQDMSIITQALGNVRWSDVTNMARDVKIVTNLLAGGFASNVLATISNSLSGVSTNLDRMADQLAKVNWDALTNVAVNVGAITSAIGQVDWRALTNVSTTVGAITQALGSVNWGALTNVSLQMSAITNAIYSVRWDALTNVSLDMSTITNALMGLRWDDIRTTISGLSNSLAGVNWRSLTNVSADVGGITAALARVDWTALTNVQATIGQITDAIYRVRWDALTNVSLDMSAITNALAGMSWSDIRTTIMDVSNRLAQVDWRSLTNVSRDVGAITNALFSVNWGSLTNVSRDVGAITSAIYSVNWAALTNASASLSGVSSGIAALSNQLLRVDWRAITNVSRDMATITNALGNLRWSDVQAIAANVTALRTDFTKVNWSALQNLPGIDIRTVAAEIIAQLESKLGQATDQPGADTMFGRLADIENSLQGVGSSSSQAANSSSQAAKKAQTARTEAGKAVKGVRDLANEVGQGDINRILSAVEEVRKSLVAVDQNVKDIPGFVGPESVSAQMQQMAGTIEKWAKSKGFQYLTNLEELPAAGPAGAPVISPDMVGKFNRNFEEIQRSMQFMQKLLDEMRYEPVVEESLVGAP